MAVWLARKMLFIPICLAFMFSLTARGAEVANVVEDDDKDASRFNALENEVTAENEALVSVSASVIARLI